MNAGFARKAGKNGRARRIVPPNPPKAKFGTPLIAVVRLVGERMTPTGLRFTINGQDSILVPMIGDEYGLDIRG
jgi:hypothetical protein